MRNITAATCEHLKRETTTLCHCWKLERRDGVVMGFTDHDKPLTFEDTVFEPASGFDAAMAESALGLSPATTQITGALSSEAIREKDIADGLFDGASVTVSLVNWANPKERFVQAVYKTCELTRSGAHFKAELETPVGQLDQTQGRSFTRLCDAELGDQRCGVDVQSPLFSATGIVSKIIAPAILEVDGLIAFEAGRFANGKFRWADGASNRASTMVADHNRRKDKTVIRLWERPPNTVAVGDPFTVIAGCDKRFSTCRDRFANQLRFRGFPHLPGNDFAMNYAANSSQHDGGPLFE